MTEVISGVSAITLHVREIGAARRFYRDVLGLQQLSFDEQPPRATFALPGTSTILRMHLYDPEEGGREPGTVTGVVFRSPDPVASCAEIRRRGGAVTHEPRLLELPHARFVMGVVADPDGNEFIISDRTD
jgi:catechol 2,3-dioxygenase-like lactoylglutathione lyase family enzyme